VRTSKNRGPANVAAGPVLNIVRSLAVTPVVVVAVIFMIPMALVVGPSTVIVVVVGVGPIGAGIGRSAPHSGGPHISASVPVPISIDPRVTRPWHRRPHLVTKRWRLMPNVDTNLGEGWSGNCCSEDETCKPFRFHLSLLTTTTHTMRTPVWARGFGNSLVNE